MRFLTKKEVLALTRLSDATIKRMEDAGTFPQRAALGDVTPTRYAKSKRYKRWNCRVGWNEYEIAEWFVQRLNAREETTSPSKRKSWTTEEALALIRDFVDRLATSPHDEALV